jgi:hypothetical protein
MNSLENNGQEAQKATSTVRTYNRGSFLPSRASCSAATRATKPEDVLARARLFITGFANNRVARAIRTTSIGGHRDG